MNDVLIKLSVIFKRNNTPTDATSITDSFIPFASSALKPLRYRFMAMERLGGDLQRVSESNRGQMKRNTVLQIGHRLVRGKVPRVIIVQLLWCVRFISPL